MVALNNSFECCSQAKPSSIPVLVITLLYSAVAVSTVIPFSKVIRFSPTNGITEVVLIEAAT